MKNEEVSILVTGDFYAGNRIDNLIKNDQYSKIFNDFLPFIQSADVSITNIESPTTNSKKPITKTGPALKSDRKLFNALKFAGFNLVTLANNHIMDYGKDGLDETIELCGLHDIDYIGAGVNFQKASESKIKQLKNKKIAFINIAENEWSTTLGDLPGANPLDPIANYYAINQAKKSADFVLVIVHGGHEMYQLPSPRMKQTYRFFIDAGADAVVGHHTHCFSGYETYKEKYIFYSLGNFIFDSNHHRGSIWNRGFAVLFKISSDINFELIPYIQNDVSPGIFLLNAEQSEIFQNELNCLNQIIEKSELIDLKFMEYVENVSKTYNSFLEPHSNRVLRYLQDRKFLPSFLSHRKKNLYLNLFRCEAHRDVILKLLNSMK